MAEPRDLGRSDLLNAPTSIVEPFDVPALSGRVWIRALSQLEIEQWEDSNKDDKNKAVPGARGRLLLKCLCDRHGNRLLKDGDLELFFRQLGHWIIPLFEKALVLNKLTKAAEEEVKKNSVADPIGDSATGSRLDLAEAPQRIPMNSSID